MKVYLIDYENVNEQGLKGVKELEKGDVVNIFYSVNIKSMPFERSIELAQSGATIDSYLIKKTGKNYLDFQLTTLLGFLICKYEKAEFFIVSKDTGFDSTVDFWKERKVQISRVTTIAGNEKAAKKKPEPKAEVKEETKQEKKPAKKPKAKEKTISKPTLSESYRKKVRSALEGEGLAPNAYTGIYKAIVECKDKVLLNNAMVKQFDNTKGGVIYGKIKPIYKEYQEEMAKKVK